MLLVVVLTVVVDSCVSDTCGPAVRGCGCRVVVGGGLVVAVVVVAVVVVAGGGGWWCCRWWWCCWWCYGFAATPTGTVISDSISVVSGS